MERTLSNILRLRICVIGLSHNYLLKMILNLTDYDILSWV